MTNHNTPRMTASIRAQIPITFPDNGRGLNSVGCLVCNESKRQIT